jgi:collagenase-like PrtC family protease
MPPDTSEYKKRVKMSELTFSLPYNNDPVTLSELFSFDGLGGNHIAEIYLSGPQEFSGSGRVTPRVGIDKFVDIIGLVHKHNIRVNLVMNPTCQGSDWYSENRLRSTLDFLYRMCDEYAIEAVTIANPVYIKAVKSQLPQLEVCASVLSDIDCIQRANIIREAGADTITPDAGINRDIDLLNDISKSTGAKIKLMVNEGCLYKCPFRKFHFNFVSHWSKELEHSTMKGKDFFDYCSAIIKKDHSQILKSPWIRPEDLDRYAGVTTYFKIVGRARPRSHVLRMVRAYMNQCYDGNLLDIICSSLNNYGLSYGACIDNKSLSDTGFPEKVLSCHHNCFGCRYCDELASMLVKLDQVTPEKLEDLGYR